MATTVRIKLLAVVDCVASEIAAAAKGPRPDHWKPSGKNAANLWTDRTNLGFWKWTPALTGIPEANSTSLWFALNQRVARENISDAASTESLRQELARPLVWEVFAHLKDSGSLPRLQATDLVVTTLLSIPSALQKSIADQIGTTVNDMHALGGLPIVAPSHDGNGYAEQFALTLTGKRQPPIAF